MARKLANTVDEASARNKVKISKSVLKAFALIIKACKYELSKGRCKLQVAEKHLMLTTCPREMSKVQEVLLVWVNVLENTSHNMSVHGMGQLL